MSPLVRFERDLRSTWMIIVRTKTCPLRLEGSWSGGMRNYMVESIADVYYERRPSYRVEVRRQGCFVLGETMEMSRAFKTCTNDGEEILTKNAPWGGL